MENQLRHQYQAALTLKYKHFSGIVIQQPLKISIIILVRNNIQTTSYNSKNKINIESQEVKQI